MFFGIKSRITWFVAFVRLEKQPATREPLWGNSSFRRGVQQILCPIDLTHFPHLCRRAGRSHVSEGYSLVHSFHARRALLLFVASRLSP